MRTQQTTRRHGRLIRQRLSTGGMNVDLAADVDVLDSLGSRIGRLSDVQGSTEPRQRTATRKEMP